MKVLDDYIKIAHVIICEQCMPEDSVFSSIDEWIRHKETYSHNKISHTCLVESPNDVILYLIYPIKGKQNHVS